GSHFSQREDMPEEAERQWETKAGYVAQAREDVRVIEAAIRPRLEALRPPGRMDTWFNVHSWPVEVNGETIPPVGYGPAPQPGEPEGQGKPVSERNEMLALVLGDVATATDIANFGRFVYETGGEREKIFPVNDGVPELDKEYHYAEAQPDSY